MKALLFAPLCCLLEIKTFYNLKISRKNLFFSDFFLLNTESCNPYGRHTVQLHRRHLAQQTNQQLGPGKCVLSPVCCSNAAMAGKTSPLLNSTDRFEWKLQVTEDMTLSGPATICVVARHVFSNFLVCLVEKMVLSAK